MNALGRFFLYVGAFLIGRSRSEASTVRALDVSIRTWKLFRVSIQQRYEDRRHEISQIQMENEAKELLYSSLRDQARVLFYVIDGEIRTLERNADIQSANAVKPPFTSERSEERQYKRIQ